MKNETDIKLFEDKKVRTIWDDENEKWYLSIVDVVAVLTGSPQSKKVLECFKNKTKSRGQPVGYKL